LSWWSKIKNLIKEDYEPDLAIDVSVDLTPTQQDVYDAVRHMPGATARELGFTFFPEDWRIPGRRLKELVDKGLVENGEKRRNQDTKIEVLTYFPVKSFLEVDTFYRKEYTKGSRIEFVNSMP
jgi:hypothetical protein